ncbi:unnamed protein product, partial [marine sediment metagenome]
AYYSLQITYHCISIRDTIYSILYFKAIFQSLTKRVIKTYNIGNKTE